MTGERAIIYICRYNRQAQNRLRRLSSLPFGPVFNLDVKITREIYRDSLCRELIRRIRSTDKDPIRVVEDYGWFLEYVLGESDDDHFKTHEFASAMCYLADEIGRYLQNCEEEAYEQFEN